MNSSETNKNTKQCSIGTLFALADREDKILIAIGLLTSLVNGTIYPIFSLLFGDMTNTFSPLNTNDEKLDQALTVMIKFIVVGCVGFVLSFIQFSCLSISSTKQTARFRLNYFQTLLRQDVKWHDKMNCNELNSKLSNDSIQFQDAIGQKFGSLVLSICQFLVGIGLGFYKGWQMSIVLTAALPFIGFGTLMMFKSINGGTEQIKTSNSKGGAIVEEYTTNIKTVKALTGENFVIKIFDGTIMNAQTNIFRSFLMMGLGLGFLYLFLFLDYALCFWYGAKLVSDKTINDHTNQVYNLGDVMTIFFSVMIGGFALGQTSPSIKAITEGRISMQNYQDVQNQQIDIILDDQTKLKDFKIEGNIELRNVSFNYPSRHDVKVLDQCSLKFLLNKKNALVGESGQGKSTIMQLIERYYDPHEGQVLVDDRDIKDYNLKQLRQQIGYIEQEPVLFNTTIRQNLLYADPNVTEQQMIECLKLANAWDFIQSTPDKLDTNMGSQGSQFSGGQKQRIAIARALLKKPNILLLDEATSALDKQNEKGIQETIDQIAQSQNITVIIIAHRLSSIINSDKIFVIDHGKLVQQGTHEELMSQIGKYRSLVALQAANMGTTNDETDNQQDDNNAIEFEEVQEVEQKVSRKQSKRKSSDLNQPLLGKKKSSNVQDLKQSVASDTDYNKLDAKQQAEVKKQVQKRLQEFKQKNSSAGLKVVVLVAMVCSLIFGTMQPFAGKLLSSFMGSLSDPYEKDFREKTNKVSYFMIGLAFMIYITQGLGFYLHSRAGQTLSDRLRMQAFDKLIQQRLQYYENKSHSPGQLSSTISSDCQQINQLISVVNGVVVSAVFSYVTGLVLAFLASWQVTLIAIGVSPLIIIAGVLNSKLAINFNKKTDEKFKEGGLIISDTFSNIRTVLSFSNTQFIQDLYSQKIKGPLEECKTDGVKAGCAYGFGQLANFLMYAIIFYTGSLLNVHNHVTVDEMFSALFCVIFAASAVGGASIYMPEYGKMINSAQSIFRIIDQEYEQMQLMKKNENVQLNDEIDYSSIKGDIEFRNVSFKYPSRNQYVLKDFSINIQSGQSVGLVGPSGCGKSTIISLLLRFYEIESGQILLDGRDIREYQLKSLRQLYGVVNQEPVLFGGNVKFNIVFNTEDRQDKDVEQACKDANAYNFIMNHEFENTKPGQQMDQKDDNKGFNRQVGNKGMQISGGQKQRLAIARAILKQPKILLLDEATSALDHQNEQLVQQSLDRVMENRTSIMIAHRMSTVVNCDNIYVISEGKIMEQGTYQDLMNKQGYFWKFQQGAL